MSEGPRFAWPQASGTLRRFRRALGTIRCDVDGADSGDPVGIAQGGLDADAIDCFEVNDAWRYRFCWEREIGVDAGRLNPWGGAIAWATSSGIRRGLTATMLNWLETNQRRYGLQTMCEAGGMANAMIVERL